MTDLGEIQSYLGILIVHNRPNRRIEIDQCGYIEETLQHFGMQNANSHSTPLPSGADEHLVKYDGEASQSDIKHYQSLIGSLLYIQIIDWNAPGHCLRSIAPSSAVHCKSLASAPKTSAVCLELPSRNEGHMHKI
jgi:hypothetical protein